MTLYSGSAFDRAFMARRGSRFISVSIMMRTDPDLPDPEVSMFEVTDLRDPAFKKSYKDAGGPVEIADLARASSLLLGAMQADTVLLATHDRIFFADLAGELNTALAGTFAPVSMSLDETGRMYLVVESEGRQSLWLLTQAGERLYAFAMPEGHKASHPPIIGYDHSVYLLAGGQIICVAPDGNPRWLKSAAGRTGGAVVTADDQLLVSEGNEVAAYGVRGDRRLVHRFEEQLVTAPIIIDGDRILVASDRRLFCLMPQ
jgi:hypothetical protein